MSAKLITLKTNHTFLATVCEETDQMMKIIEPVQVVSVPPRSSSDQANIAFVPFLEFSTEFKEGIVIQKQDVLTITTPVIELLNQYNSIFGSGITIATSLLNK
jgi:hypothetical protein